MDVSFRVDGEVRTVTDVVDVERESDGYTVTFDDGSVEPVDGVVVGVANVWDNYGASGVYGETCAIELSTEGRLDVPEMALASDSSVESGEWEYDDDFDFGVREMDPRDGTLVLRNVSAFSIVGAEPVSEERSDWYRVKAGEGGFDVDGLVDEVYQVSFGSAWGWDELPGTVERVSMYVDDDSVRKLLKPTSETFKRVEWAFDEAGQ